VQGTVAGEPVRKSLDLTNWERATEVVRDMELAGTVEMPKDDRIMVTDAIQKFITDATARNLASSTLKKYRVLLGPPSETKRERSPTLTEFCLWKGIRFLRELDADLLREFRVTWKDAPLASSKKLERLRAFFNHAEESEWITKSPAKAVKAPITDSEAPTLPFSDEELGKLYRAFPKFASERRKHARGPETDHLERFPVLMQVLEFSGLRIGDACGLTKNDLVKGKLWVDTAKTGVKVYIPIPEHVVVEMEKLPLFKGKYFFWTGNGKVDTAAGNYRRTLRALAEEAGVEDVHPHRWRDTVAVRLLENGVPLERVAKILGHKSVRITERSYGPWVRALQETLEADVNRVWDGWKDRPKLVRVK
jgi:integrase